MAKRTGITIYSVSFRGVFGRNRTSKFCASDAAEAPSSVNGVDVKKLARDDTDHAGGLGLLRGLRGRVASYAGCVAGYPTSRSQLRTLVR